MAVPTGAPGPNLEEERALQALYQQLDGELRTVLARAARGGYAWRRASGLLVQVRERLAEFGVEAEALEGRVVRAAAKAGQEEAAQRLAALQAQGVYVRADEGAVWGQLNSGPLQQLAKDLAGQRAAFLGSILRQSEDFLRRVASGEIARGLGLGVGSADLGRAIRDRSIEQLRAGGVLQELAEDVERAAGVVYRDGSVHSLQAYGQMAARTGMARGFEAGNLAQYEAAGIELYEVARVGTLCYICRPWEGTVGTIGGNRVPGYPELPRWPAHPQCVHSVYPYIPEVMGPGKVAPEWAWGETDAKVYYRRMRSTPEGRQLMEWARRGFKKEAEARRLTRNGLLKDVFAKDFRRPGIEKLRIRATELVIAGQYPTYRQAMAALTIRRTTAIKAAEKPEQKPPAFYKFGSLTEARAWAREHFREWRRGVTRAEHDAITLYQSSGYRVLNRALRRRDQEGMRVHQTSIRNLDKAIAKGTLGRSIVVYRGIPEQPGETVFEEYLIARGKVITEQGYCSTTLDGAFARKWANGGYGRGILMEVRVPAGMKAAYLGEGFLSLGRKEAELLLPRGCQLKVLEAVRDESGMGRLVCEVLPDEG